MSREQKILTIMLWSAVAIVAGGLAAAWFMPVRYVETGKIEVHPSEPKLRIEDLWDAPDFALTDQQERQVSAEQLRGNVWVASFIFTRCAGPCPLMTQKMSMLQRQIDHPDVRFVSFTVDPDHDTPAVLHEYADRFGADHARWHFLTGPRPQILATAAGMRLTAVPVEGEIDIIHSEKFVVIDQDGRIRGYYHGIDPEQLEQLADDALALAERKP